MALRETSPLLSDNGEKKGRKTSGTRRYSLEIEDSRTSPSSDHTRNYFIFENLRSSTYLPAPVSGGVSKFLQAYPSFTRNLEFAFRLILNNSLLCCLGILIIKGIVPALLHERTNGAVAILGNWNLQLADCMLVLSYSIRSFLWLRICLCLACICFVVYAFTSPIGIMLDMAVFNWTMALLNLSHAITLVYEKRHIDFSPEFEQIYDNLFASYMSRTDYEKLVKVALVRTEKDGVVMKQEGDLVTSLCVLVKGQIIVKRLSQKINVLKPNEIIEAPEWVRSQLNPENARFNLSFVACGTVTYVKWSRETLVDILDNHPQIKTAVLAVLGIKTAELWLRSVGKDPNTSIYNSPERLRAHSALSTMSRNAGQTEEDKKL